MNIRFTKEISDALPDDLTDDWGIQNHYSSEEGVFDAATMDKETTERFLKLSKEMEHLKGIKVFVGGFKKHLQVLNGKMPKASGASQMESLLEDYIAVEIPNQIVYLVQNERHFGFRLCRVDFRPAYRDRDNRHIPAKIELRGEYVHAGSRETKNWSWTNADCYCTPAQLLAKSGILIQTDELAKEYSESYEKFLSCLKVGDQWLTSGMGYTHRGGWGSSRNNNDADYEATMYHLGANGNSIVVTDVVDDEEGRANSKNFNERFYGYSHEWGSIRKRYFKKVGKEDPAPEPEHDDERDLREIPVHPLIPCFDLGRHNTYTIHALDLIPYPWDTSIFEKLVIPGSNKHLIHTLSQSGEFSFTDLVKGKSGGTNILLTGEPGTGKTLTAEIFAESTKRPLYRVHCSQLGTKPDSMESELLDVFRRAARWDAIILLDEADVYIRDRGTDLQANAVVGVFLRVLEYQTSVLFMTTNLPDSVDDAIASRCVARVDYIYPDKEDLAEIWRVLAAGNKMEISEETIEEAVKWLPMTGRDVKNTLKLIQTAKAPVTFETINAASSFHPNRGNWNLSPDMPKADTALLLGSAVVDADKAKKSRAKKNTDDCF